MGYEGRKESRTDLGVDVARDVDDRLRVELDELLEERLVTSLSRGLEACNTKGRLSAADSSSYGLPLPTTHIKHDRRLLPREPSDTRKDLLTLPRQERALVLHPVQLRVRLCVRDRLGINLDSGDDVKVLREGDSEQAGSTVGVDEVSRGREGCDGDAVEGGGGGGGEDGVSDVGGERDEDRVVVLEEGAGRESEVEFADALVHRCF